MTCAATGAVRNTKKIPRNKRMLNVPSMIKNRNVPTKVNRTPIVELFEAAWAREYKSGNRISPTALKKLKIVPTKIDIAAMTSNTSIGLFTSLNDNTSFNKSRKGNCSNERKDPD